DPKFGDTCIEGLRSHYQYHRFPASITTGVFAQLVSAHGDYQIEIQLQTPEGESVWQEGPPGFLAMPDPVMVYELKFSISLVFPKPGPYVVVLLANGEEIGREQSFATQTGLAEKD